MRTGYQYDGDTVLTEKQNGSTFVNRYQRGAGGELLTRPGFGSGASGETPQMDGLGNMRQALSNSSATLVSSFDYSAFGEVIGGGGNSSSPYGWGAQSGYREDGGSGHVNEVGVAILLVIVFIGGYLAYKIIIEPMINQIQRGVASRYSK